MTADKYTSHNVSPVEDISCQRIADAIVSEHSPAHINDMHSNYRHNAII